MLNGYEPANKRAKALSVALRERDERTSAHCNRVVDLAVELGRKRGLAESELELLGLSAEFHDVGKIGIPDSVLLKPGELSGSERDIVKSHAEIGQRIVLEIDIANIQTVGLAVRHHHERYDGRGYPDGLEGDDIPLFARIIALADTYDSMAGGRTYRKAMPHRQIMELLALERGRQHDASLFSDFESIIERSEHRARTNSLVHETRAALASSCRH
jgi:HD-GYP domain-containing protein (c-di-GMP phosphodiesterase class II)